MTTASIIINIIIGITITVTSGIAKWMQELATRVLKQEKPILKNGTWFVNCTTQKSIKRILFAHVVMGLSNGVG